MLRFEYLKTGVIGEEEMEKLGWKGWELVAVDRGEYIFKRQRGNISLDGYKPDLIEGR